MITHPTAFAITIGLVVTLSICTIVAAITRGVAFYHRAAHADHKYHIHGSDDLSSDHRRGAL